MSNKLIIIGKMFHLSIQPITKRQFNRLIKDGRKSNLYDELIEQSGNFIELTGYYLFEGKPTFEVYINDQKLGIESTFKIDHKITYYPINGSTYPLNGHEKYYLITEQFYEDGYSGIEFDEIFNPKELTFEIYRQGFFNRTICSTISPIYKNTELNFYSNNSSSRSDYIISTKGQLHTFPFDELSL